MKGFVTLGAILAMAAPAMAQAQEDYVEGRVRRLKEQLQLTDEQTAKVRDIEKKRYDDLRASLTEDQKRRYEESTNGGGGRGGNQPQGRGRTSGGGFPSSDELKTQLSLTDDQASKVGAIRDASREQFRNLFQNRARGTDSTAEMTKIREETNRKIRDVLTDEQKPKFDDIVKASQDRQAAAPAGGDTQRRGGSLDERVTRAMERLRVENATEADAIKGLVRKVIEVLEKQETFQREARGKLDATSRNPELSDDAVGKQIDEIHTGQRDIEKELGAARKDLAEVVTNRQEGELIRLGLLK